MGIVNRGIVKWELIFRVFFAFIFEFLFECVYGGYVSIFNYPLSSKIYMANKFSILKYKIAINSPKLKIKTNLYQWTWGGGGGGLTISYIKSNLVRSCLNARHMKWWGGETSNKEEKRRIKEIKMSIKYICFGVVAVMMLFFFNVCLYTL